MTPAGGEVTTCCGSIRPGVGQFMGLISDEDGRLVYLSIVELRSFGPVVNYRARSR